MNKLQISALLHTFSSITLELSLAVTAALVNYKMGLLVMLLVITRRASEAIHNTEVMRLEVIYKKEMTDLLTKTFSAPQRQEAQSNENVTLQ